MPIAAPPPQSLRVTVHGEIGHLAAEWQALAAQGHCTAFQTWAWMRPFYEVLAPRLGAEPVILRVADARTDRPLMLWPMVRRRRMGMAVLEWADLGVSDYNAPLLAADWPLGPLANEPAWQDTWREVCRQLRALPGLGVALQVNKAPLRIGQVPNPLLATLATDDPLPLPGAALWARPSTMSFGAWAVGLPTSFEAYQSQVLSPSFQKDLALRHRRLARKGPIRFALAVTPEERRQAFETMAQQRARRFAETGRTDILAEPDFRRFYEAAAIDAPGQTVRLFTLQAGEALVAVLLALDHAGTRHVVMPTFEAGEWKNCSPGNLLLWMAIEDAIGQGMGCMDFTIGDEAYKASFGAGHAPVFDLVQPLSLGGVALAGARQGARRVREWWRSTALDPAQAVATSLKRP